MLELRREDGGSAAVTLSGQGRGGGKGAVSVVQSVDGARAAWSCPAVGGSCALAGGVSASGKVFVASVSEREEEGGSFSGVVFVVFDFCYFTVVALLLLLLMLRVKRQFMFLIVIIVFIVNVSTIFPCRLQPTPGASAKDDAAGKLVITVAEVTAWGDFMAAPVSTFETGQFPSLGRGASGSIQAAFLEAGEGDACVSSNAKTCFRALVVREDDSATMVGEKGVAWVREEALAEVDKVRGGRGDT